MIKDSGNRREFETGAVRDMQEGKGRCDLMPLDVVSHILSDDRVLMKISEFMEQPHDPRHLVSAIYEALVKQDDEGYFMFGADIPTMLLEVSVHFEEGAAKYGEMNWQHGIPVKCYIDSAVRHYLKWLRGDDDERHDRAFMWNLICCLWEIKQNRTQGRSAAV
jgi:hypothetical protein